MRCLAPIHNTLSLRTPARLSSAPSAQEIEVILLPVHGHIADFQRSRVHPQRNEDRDDLENDEGRDRVKHDDKERGYRLVFELREIAIVPDGASSSVPM
jgi:hypothetical protein